MIFYSTRSEMENAFRDWCNKTHAAMTPNGMLVWLAGYGYLNEEKIQKDFPLHYDPGIKIKEVTRE